MDTMMKKQFDFYRNWFSTLLIKDFLNLSYSNQERFISLAEKFLKDCKDVHSEAKNIKEKNVIINNLFTENDNVYGFLNGKKIQISVPVKTKRFPDSITCTVYSLDGTNWYSLKEELIKKEVQHDVKNES